MCATWHVLIASARGAAHEATSLPNQDAIERTASLGTPDEPLAVAVSDGHGDRRHFRSARGSQFATRVACTVARKVSERLGVLDGSRAVAEVLRGELVSEIVEGWRRAVVTDLQEFPLTQGERAITGRDDDPTIPYGATLLLTIVTERWLSLAQIGDGDAIVVRYDGATSAPVPGDPALDGRHTTSLCTPHATDLFRIAVIDLNKEGIGAVLLATDGFGNAQIEDSWYQSVGRDVARLVREHGIGWVGQHLSNWTARCASSEGSGDDTSVALLLKDDLSRRVI